MYNRKSKGQAMEPWGTPSLTGLLTALTGTVTCITCINPLTEAINALTAFTLILTVLFEKGINIPWI